MVELITWIGIGLAVALTLMATAMMWPEIMVRVEKTWLALRDVNWVGVLLDIWATISFWSREAGLLTIEVTGIQKLYKRYRYAPKHANNKMVQFHWWEFISAEGLSGSDLIRWPYPATVHNLRWIRRQKDLERK
jgi:hypothetical protein